VDSTAARVTSERETLTLVGRTAMA
jgi:hypothetical protein